MTQERFEQLRAQLRSLARTGEVQLESQPLSGLGREDARAMFRAQLVARHLDAEAIRLRAKGAGYYTITSAGHEGNVAVGYYTRATDPALLHYRSGALFAARAMGHEVDPITAVVLGLCASAEELIAGGRHKVFGSVELGVVPQTSTIASQLPKAVGVALSLDRARRLGHAAMLGGKSLPRDAIAVTSFGDASLNHASATVAFNAARWVAHQGLPLPLLFVCEDNGLGISVKSPAGWTERCLRSMTPLDYFVADGCDLGQTAQTTQAAIALCRTQRKPVILHLRCTRLMGHSGADPDATYRSPQEVAQLWRRDPVLHAANQLLAAGMLTGDELLAWDDAIAQEVQQAGERASQAPKLQSAAQVMEPLYSHYPEAVLSEAKRADFEDARIKVHGGAEGLPERKSPQPMGRMINWALHELLAKYPQALLFGEDVAEKGGVYNLTAGLWKSFGAGRVFNTLLDETTILALAQGAGLLGMLPVPEIQYLAFLHNAEDQLRGEAASTSFFSCGQFKSPMVLRIAGYGYQKGFGGHFHNDNSIAVLRDIPGLIVVTPSSGADAVKLLRTCFAAAHVDGRVVAIVEPIALYHQRDLHESGDGGWTASYPAPGSAIGFGEVGWHGHAQPDLLIVTYGNGVRMARRVAARLSQQRDETIAVLDLRWLSPLPCEAVRKAAACAKHVLVVDECRREGGVGEAIVSDLACANAGGRLNIALVTAKSSFIPLGDAAELVLPSEADIEHAALALMKS